jgi:glutaredoxin
MNIIIYTKTGCPWCEGALTLLKEKNVPFEEREVRNNKEYWDELVAKSGQNKTPTLDIDGFILADSDKDQIAAYLKEKGTEGF